MKTITLTNSNRQPIHSRHVRNDIYNTAALAKVVANRIVAIYAQECELPKDRFGVVPIVNGIIDLEAARASWYCA
jgi:hypothetical protein